MHIDLGQLKIELARAACTQRRLAVLLEVPPTTLSSWLVGAHPPPEDLGARIERALGVSAGTLTTEALREA